MCVPLMCGARCQRAVMSFPLTSASRFAIFCAGSSVGMKLALAIRPSLRPARFDPAVEFQVMLGILLLVLSLGIVLLLALFAASAWRVAFSESPEQFQSVLPWKLPRALGNELLTWATSMVRSIASRRLAKPRNRDTAEKLMADVFAASTYAINQSSCPESKVPKCPSSRCQMIGVTPPEAIMIAETIRQSQTKQQLQQLHDRTAENAEMVRGLNREQYERAHLVCPLCGDDGRCVAYEARPVQCHGWRVCRDENERDTNGGATVLLDAHSYTVSRGAELGLADAIDSAGLDGHVYELNHALTVALEHPDSAEKWAEGKPLFQSCKTYG